MTVRDWIVYATERLAKAGVSQARLEAQLLLAHALRIDREWLLLLDEHPAPDDARRLLERRLTGEPIAYIIGWREFYRRRFEVNPAVLVPRPETEILVEAVLELAKPGDRCLDVGTGSGCIGVTCALERPDTRWILTDVSPQALAVARRNAERHGAPCQFLLADALSAFRLGSVDLIVCNPPYIPHGDPRLEPSVRRFEPASALFAGATGLEFFERLAAEAPAVLAQGGVLAVEVGQGQADAVAALFRSATERAVRKDLAGMARVVIAIF